MPRPKTDWITRSPITHRGLHDGNKTVMENSIGSAEASIKAGLAIELDLQISSDGVPVVFHDYELSRVTGVDGNTRDRSAKELSQIAYLAGSNSICPLPDYLEFVDGRVGLVLELKGLEGKDDGFVSAVADCLKDYDGPAAVMSFDQQLVEEMIGEIADRPVGLTAYGDDTDYEKHMSFSNIQALDFISYDIKNIDCRFLAEMREQGKASISWTVRSPEQHAKSDQFCDQITFEGFMPEQVAT